MSNKFLLLGLVLLVDSYSIKERNDIVDESTVGNDKTVGNDVCYSSKCGFHDGKPFSWCYINRVGGWDYCCVTPCQKDSVTTSIMTCEIGNGERKVCGTYMDTTVTGKKCRPGHVCGNHKGVLDYGYWCFIDTLDNWEHCCNPLDKCSQKGYYYNWCLTGLSTTNFMEYEYCK